MGITYTKISIIFRNDEKVRKCAKKPSDMNLEEDRLNTFPNSWPHLMVSPYILAAIGFYYVGGEHNDEVACQFCGIHLLKWEESDDEVHEHFRWSPDCPLINKKITRNKSINEARVDRIIRVGKDVGFYRNFGTTECDCPYGRMGGKPSLPETEKLI